MHNNPLAESKKPAHVDWNFDDNSDSEEQKGAPPSATNFNYEEMKHDEQAMAPEDYQENQRYVQFFARLSARLEKELKPEVDEKALNKIETHPKPITAESVVGAHCAIFACHECQEISRQPKSCKFCRQIYCEPCADKILGSKSAKCENCKRPWQKREEVVDLVPHLRNLYFRTVVKCAYCPEGFYKLKDENRHYRENCETFKVYKCNDSNKQCKESEEHFKSISDLRELHWGNDCPAFVKTCERCLT